MAFVSLKSNADFTKLYKRGKYHADKNIVLYYRKNHLEETRVGFSISKKVGNSVVRHRLKRLMKEVFRLNHDGIIGYDLVFVARVNSSNADYHTIARSMDAVIRKAPELRPQHKESE